MPKKVLHAHRLCPREDEPVDDLPLVAHLAEPRTLWRANASS
jgi:hypothetical protein